ncbi:hypothetical protein [Sulfurospirillum sp. 1612]|uniref:hypothetical protein n=1 Tax=Sulfurospirillum sp. 1612 TaxID=3094835 RepID=UPI002F9391FB
MKKNVIDKIIDIYNRSELSISKFAVIVGKDRRTVTSWIDKLSHKSPNEEILERISSFFRYPNSIWDDDCQGDDFLDLLTKVPKEEVKIIDEGYLGGLKYIIKYEDKERFVIHSQFPGPMYRDTTVPRVYRTQSSTEIEVFKQERVERMLSYSFQTVEWYSIKALLSFCFSPIGNFYTKEQKILILDLMYNNFHENYNKKLYFFDSFSRKVYGLDTIYTSINIKNGVIFFKAPLESVIIEVSNKKLVERIHRHFTDGKEAPAHVHPSDATEILQILRRAIQLDHDLLQAYVMIDQQTQYGEIFKNNLSLSLIQRMNKEQGQKH